MAAISRTSVSRLSCFQWKITEHLFPFFHWKQQHVKNIAPVRKIKSGCCIVGNMTVWNPAEMRRWDIFPKHSQPFISVPLATRSWAISIHSAKAKIFFHFSHPFNPFPVCQMSFSHTKTLWWALRLSLWLHQLNRRTWFYLFGRAILPPFVGAKLFVHAPR